MRRTDRGQIITLSCIAGLSAISLATPAIVLATRQESNIISVKFSNFSTGQATTNDINYALNKTYKLSFQWKELSGIPDRSGSWVIAAVGDQPTKINKLIGETCKIYVDGIEKINGVDFVCQSGLLISPLKSFGVGPDSEVVVMFELDTIDYPTGVIGIMSFG